tara:strand:+ start:44855 stop:45937 length:1083 start_codon:yes stop_codon:yes gene_type:complete
MRRAWAEINLQALQHNYQVVRAYAPKSKILAMLKANAYGHGLVYVAKALKEADAFGVASMDEALVLRQAGLTNPIFLMEGFFQSDALDLLQDCQLTTVIHNFEQMKALQDSQFEKPVPVWLKVNTGMNRLGFHPDDFLAVYQQLKKIKAVDLQGVMTHFPQADDLDCDMTKKQINQFNAMLMGLTEHNRLQKSLANSAGIMAWPNSHQDWVRPGLMLYGASPVMNQSSSHLNLKPVMQLFAEVIAIQSVAPGQTVGYGGTWKAQTKSKVAVVSIGYGDGYPWHAQTGTPVLINDKICKTVGRPSMDMLTADVSHMTDIAIGDKVTLWGQNLPIEVIAKSGNTISYEIFCRLTERVSRKLI